MKFDGNILDSWFQDKLSREKVKLSGRSGKLAESARRVGVGLKVVAQALSVKYSRVLRRMVISRVGRIVEGNRESFIVFTLLFIKSNEVQTKLRYVRLLLLYGDFSQRLWRGVRLNLIWFIKRRFKSYSLLLRCLLKRFIFPSNIACYPKLLDDSRSLMSLTKGSLAWLVANPYVCSRE